MGFRQWRRWTLGVGLMVLGLLLVCGVFLVLTLEEAATRIQPTLEPLLKATWQSVRSIDSEDPSAAEQEEVRGGGRDRIAEVVQDFFDEREARARCALPQPAPTLAKSFRGFYFLSPITGEAVDGLEFPIAVEDEGDLLMSVHADEAGEAALELAEGPDVAVTWPAIPAGQEGRCEIRVTESVGVMVSLHGSPADGELLFIEGCELSASHALTYPRLRIFRVVEPCDVRAVRVVDGLRAAGPWRHVPVDAGGVSLELDVSEVGAYRSMTDDELAFLDEASEAKRAEAERRRRVMEILSTAGERMDTESVSDEQLEAFEDGIDALDGMLEQEEELADLAEEMADAAADRPLPEPEDVD